MHLYSTVPNKRGVGINGGLDKISKINKRGVRNKRGGGRGRKKLEKLINEGCGN